MLTIRTDGDGTLRLRGRFDASQAERAEAELARLSGATTVDLSGLDYISSVGLGVLLKTQKRLRAGGGEGLRLVGVSPHIHDIFRLSGFHRVFEIER